MQFEHFNACKINYFLKSKDSLHKIHDNGVVTRVKVKVIEIVRMRTNTISGYTCEW